MPKIKVPERYYEALLFDQGETIRLKMPYVGNPEPQAQWLRDGKVLETNDKYEVKIEKGDATLIIKNAQDPDKGKYNLKLTSALGTDVATVKINFTDKPDPPGKPTIYDVNLDSVRIRYDFHN